MSKLPSVLIDPYVLCLSAYEGGDDGFDAFVEKITAWSELTARSDIEILFSEDCLLGMYEDNCYPNEYKIRSFYRANPKEYVDEQTLCTIVKTVLDSTPTLESRSKIKTVLFDEKTCQINPREIIERLQEKTQSSFKHCLNLFSLWNSLSDIEHVIGSNCDGFKDDFDGQLSINSTIHDAEYFGKGELQIDFPVSLDCHHPVCRCFDEILEQVDILDLWNNARDQDAVTDAINRQTLLLIKAGIPNNQSNYRLGTNLLDSLQGWNFSKRADWARNFIETCARIILQNPKNPIRPFWEDIDKKIRKIRNADGAKAYRTRITKKSEGFRLMFWKLSDGTIEFANVGSKNELIIYE